MIEQITAFTRQATDIKFKLSQITHLKLDMSSAEAVKRLKGKNLFANGKSKRDRICLILYNLIFFFFQTFRIHEIMYTGPYVGQLYNLSLYLRDLMLVSFITYPFTFLQHQYLLKRICLLTAYHEFEYSIMSQAGL